MLQILRQGKDIIKDPKAWIKLKNVDDGKIDLFEHTMSESSLMKHEPQELDLLE